ncbi:MAG: roadblock/LC7 domain-containing protein [Acidobacteriota bacterium]|nr:roadblock/LC7 domain-containing protein [Acidobacteriota bacterium]
MSNFKKALGNILESTEGAICVMLMGTDGIPVEKVIMPGTGEENLDIAATEMTSLVRNAQRTGHNVGFGSLSELVVRMQNATFLIRQMSNEYFIVLALDSEGNIGRGRFELRKAELDLSREFAL